MKTPLSTFRNRPARPRGWFALPMALGLLLAGTPLLAQTTDPDELFRQAREAAFEQKDYPKAIALCQQVLTRSPTYHDVRNFLGRIYTWTDKPDDARAQFNTVLKNDSTNRDAYSALTDLNYWNDRPEEALGYVNHGLRFYPTDEELLLKKARVLNSQNRYAEANATLATLLKQNPTNTDARTLQARIRWAASRNTLTLGYDYLYFNQQYNDALHLYPWHVASVALGHQTRYGTVIGRVNYAHRFAANGVQFEVDAYPRISPTFYAYVNAGVSNGQPAFPHFRGGFSLYANLPKSFEGEAGFRLLQFSTSTWIYTASLGKYYKSWWFNLRTYLVPASPEWSKSLIGTVRYYFGGADDYIDFAGGSGISPDETRNVLLEGSRQLHSLRFGSEFRKSIRRVNVISLNASYLGQDLPSGLHGGQFGVGCGYRRMF